MILTILTREPLHGYRISQRLAAFSRDRFHINPDSLFPSLYRLEADGKLRAIGATPKTPRAPSTTGLTPSRTPSTRRAP